MTQQDPDKEESPEATEVENIEALKQALAEERAKAETNLARYFG